MSPAAAVQARLGGTEQQAQSLPTQLARGLAAAAAAALLALPAAPPASAESLTFPLARDPTSFAVQVGGVHRAVLRHQDAELRAGAAAPVAVWVARPSFLRLRMPNLAHCHINQAACLHGRTVASTHQYCCSAKQKTMVEAWAIVNETFVSPPPPGAWLLAGGSRVQSCSQWKRCWPVRGSIPAPTGTTCIPTAHPHSLQRHLFTYCAEWDQDLVSSLTAVADAKSGDEARKEIPALLSKLNDPFTRWLPPK